MNITNLTPHDITVVSDDGAEDTVTYPRSGRVARVEERLTRGESLAHGKSVGIMRVEYGDLIDLPAPADGERYIVSALTVLAAARLGRTTADLMYPGELVRDIAGRVIGCRCLYQLATPEQADAGTTLTIPVPTVAPLGIPLTLPALQEAWGAIVARWDGPQSSDQRIIMAALRAVGDGLARRGQEATP